MIMVVVGRLCGSIVSGGFDGVEKFYTGIDVSD